MFSILDMYSDLRIGWRFFGFLGLVGIYFGIFRQSNNVYEAAQVVFIWVGICIIFAGHQAKRRMKDMNRILMDGCQVRVYIKMMTRIEESCQRRRRVNSNTWAFIRLSLARAYLLCGEAEDAYAYLIKYSDLGKKNDAGLDMTYKTLLCEYYLLIRDTEKAESTLAEFEKK